MVCCCSNYATISITVLNVKGKCEHNLKKGMTFEMKDLIPEGLCVHAYNVAYPYCLTLLKKGWFLWVKEGDGVIVQCPNPDCSLVMKIKPDFREVNAVCINIIDVRGRCKNGHKIDDMFIFTPDEMKICPEIFPAVYAPATMLYYNEKEKGEVIVQTAICKDSEVTLRIKKG